MINFCQTHQILWFVQLRAGEEIAAATGRNHFPIHPLLRNPPQSQSFITTILIILIILITPAPKAIKPERSEAGRVM